MARAWQPARPNHLARESGMEQYADFSMTRTNYLAVFFIWVTLGAPDLDSECPTWSDNFFVFHIIFLFIFKDDSS